MVVPDVDCIILKPLNEYSISSRTIILAGGVKLRFQVDFGRETDVSMVIDGASRIRLEDGDQIIVSPLQVVVDGMEVRTLPNFGENAS